MPPTVGGNIYEYSVTGLNTSGATNPPDSGEPDGKGKDIFLDWLATLPELSFGIRILFLFLQDRNGTKFQIVLTLRVAV
jgi:hypothetical protein